MENVPTTSRPRDSQVITGPRKSPRHSQLDAWTPAVAKTAMFPQSGRLHTGGR